jgi:predicted O-linked N-acetylglucosamine transferase (SPINDLY family)
MADRASPTDRLSRAVASHRAQRFDEAARLYREILDDAPGQFDALHLFGVLEAQRRNYDVALDLLTRAVTANPAVAAAHSNRGNVLLALRRFDDAVASYRRGLAIDPAYLEAWYNLGNAFLAGRHPDEALEAYDRVLAARPDHLAALNNRGNALRALKRTDEALDSYRRALAIQPGSAEVIGNVGITLGEAGRLGEAFPMLDKAIALKPDHVEALAYRADALAGETRYDEAAADLERVLAVDAEHKYALGDLMHYRMQMCDWRRAAADWSAVRERIGRAPVAKPFVLLGSRASLAEQLANAKLYAATEYPAGAPLWRGEAYGHDRLRVAYMSGEFGEYATSLLVAELLERHDRARFEIVAVSTGGNDGSPRRKRIEAAVERLVDIEAMTDAAAAAAIRAAEIDVLVDLNGYFGRMRPGVLTLRPAPVQVNYLGFPGTVAIDAVDYILADAVVVPDGDDGFYSEKIVRLPDCYQANDSQKAIAEEMPTRAEVGLPERGFVFCCFNNNYKIAPGIFDVWMRLLQAVEGSVLWLIEGNLPAVGNLRREAAARGVDPERIVFAPRIKIAFHLARHRLADLFLDTLPHNAHTTASDSLWAGVPVLTCLGGTFAGRVGASLLTAIGLPELVARSLPEYEALALRLAREPELLASLRERLARNRATHPLFDAARLCRNVERAYATMAERVRRGEPPESFAVTDR